MNEQRINEVVRDVMDDFLLCESINEMIDESLGIATNVENATYSFLDKVKMQLQTATMVHYDNWGLRFKELYFDQKLSNTIIHISLYVLYFKSVQDYKSKEEVIDKFFKNSSDVKSNQITMHVIAINGLLDFKQLASSFQHEIKHHYDEIMGCQSPSNNIRNYSIAANAIRNGCNDLEYAIASIVYFANKYETSAFANGLYGLLTQIDTKHKIDKEILDIVKATDAYQYCMDMDKSIKIIKDANGSNELNKLLKKYNITIEEATKLANYGKKNGFRQIGRAITLYRNKHLNDHIFYKPKDISAYYYVSPFRNK